MLRSHNTIHPSAADLHGILLPHPPAEAVSLCTTTPSINFMIYTLHILRHYTPSVHFIKVYIDAMKF